MARWTIGASVLLAMACGPFPEPLPPPDPGVTDVPVADVPDAPDLPKPDVPEPDGPDVADTTDTVDAPPPDVTDVPDDNPCAKADWWPDCDGDTFALPAAEATSACQEPEPVGDCQWTGKEPVVKGQADCDDLLAAISPLADELPGDEIDQDCDGREDCFADADNDGFVPLTEDIVDSEDIFCNADGEAKADAPRTDCCDKEPDAFPGQLVYFAEESACAGYDFDCDGKVIQKWKDTVVGCGWDAFDGCGTPPEDEGWCTADPANPCTGVPECGQQKTWLSNCHKNGATSCIFSTELRAQECR